MTALKVASVHHQDNFARKKDYVGLLHRQIRYDSIDG